MLRTIVKIACPCLLIVALGFFVAALFLPRTRTEAVKPLSRFIARIDRFQPLRLDKAPTATDGTFTTSVAVGPRPFPFSPSSTSFHFPIATYMGGPHVGEFELKSADAGPPGPASTCHWTSGTVSVSDNAWVTLSPRQSHGAGKSSEAGSTATDDTPSDGCVLRQGDKLDFTFRPAPHGSGSEINLALWTRSQLPEFYDSAMLVGGTPLSLPVSGYVSTSEVHPPIARVELLAHLWGLPVVAVAAGLLLGACFLCFAALALRPGAGEPSVRVRALAAVVPMVGGLFVFSLVVPPMHGPDEPNHVIAYSHRPGAATSGETALEVARRGHFRDIRSQDLARFAVSDKESPTTETWPPFIAAYDAPARSLFTTIVWDRIYTPALRSLGITDAIYSLRALGVLVFLLILSPTILLFAKPRAWPLIAAAIASSPMIYFNGSNFSNYVLVAALAAAVALGTVSLSAVLRSPLEESTRSARIPRWEFARIAALGILCTCAYYTSMSLIPMLLILPLATTLLEDPFGAHTSRWREWGMRLAVFVAVSIATESFLVALLPASGFGGEILALGSGFLPAPAVILVGKWPWSCASISLAALATLVRIARRAIARRVARSPSPSRRPGRLESASLAAVIAGLPILSTIAFRKTVVPDIEAGPAGLSAFTFARRFVQHFYAQTGAWEPSWYGKSLWGLFGAVDRAFSDAVVRGFQAFGWIAFTCGVWRLATARTSPGSRFAMVCFCHLAVVGPLFLLAYGNYFRYVNLHGRYTLGVHVFMLVIAALGFDEALERSGDGAVASRREALHVAATVVACVQLATSAWLATRYLS